MVQTLKEYIKANPCKGFKSVPNYFPSGDFLTFYTRDVRCFERRVDDRLTLYLEVGTEDLVGCKIKGVRHILETAGDFNVNAGDGKLKLSFLFFTGAVAAKEEGQAKMYKEAGRMAGETSIDRELIGTA